MTMRHGERDIFREVGARQALFSNSRGLLTNGASERRDAKAKETRRMAERTITGPPVGDVITEMQPAAAPRNRRAFSFTHSPWRAGWFAIRGAVVKDGRRDRSSPSLDRRGGYTRIVKLGQRPGGRGAGPLSSSSRGRRDARLRQETGPRQGRASKAKAARVFGFASHRRAADKAEKNSAPAETSCQGEAGQGHVARPRSPDRRTAVPLWEH